MAKALRAKKAPPSTVDRPGDEPAPFAGGGGEGSRSPVALAQERDEIEILEALREEAGNGGYVRLGRRIDGTMEYATITRIEIAEYSQDRVQQVYGGGYYRVKFYTSAHKFLGVRNMIIDPTIPFKNPAAAVATPAAAPVGQDIAAILKEVLANKPAAAATGPGENTLVALFTLVTTQQQQASERFEKLLLKMSEAQKPAGMDPLAMKLLEIQLSRERTPVSELLESFSAFKKITGGKGGDEEDEPLTIWDKAGKILGPIAEGLAAKYLGEDGGQEIVPRRLLAAPADTTVVAPAAADGAAKPIPFPKPTTQPMNTLMQMQINRLLAAAVAASKQNADPVAFAKELMDEIPPKFYEQMEGYIKTDEWFQTLFGKADGKGGFTYHPDALAAKDWITKMRDSLLAELLEVLGPGGT